MSDYTTTATAYLDINGKKAKEEIDALNVKLVDLNSKLKQAISEGNKADMSKWQREINKTEKQISKTQSTIKNMERALLHLDTATPKQLKDTLRTLNKQLQGMERGTKAWNDQITLIRAVKQELQDVNKEAKIQEGNWSRLSRKLNEWQTSIAIGVAGFSGITGAARSAVKAYAQMDQEMANVRKYTNMNKEQVAALNEEFKKMDTRSGRDELNRLAGEAGRLGKTSQEDVLGFVRAADQINVALDELGDGATLTLSKLTGIFGDEQRLGTERSLLAVGSVINELSQNCSASAPYLAEFASRMGGVGAQAGMTVQQIMGFGAVLDSNNQKVEASSTALSQVIMRIYQDPAKYARVAGMDVQKFAEKVRTDMNGALIEFLETLSNAGKMDTLAPMFKDMGENGARAISALSTLAGHIEEVKSQQQVANKAFSEATSVTKEFQVQNTTVQAELDKARKRVSELAIELGEKLQPVMKHVLSSTSVILRVMSTVITYIASHIGTITTLTVAIVAYVAAVKAATIAAKANAVAEAIFNGVHKAGHAILATRRTLLLLCNAAIAKTTGNTIRLNAAQKLLNTTMKSNVIGLAAAAVAALLVVIGKAIAKAHELTAAQKAMNDIRKQANEKAQEQIQRINTLREAAQNEALAEEDRLKAVKQLNDINPDFCAAIDKTTGKYSEATKAVNDYIKQLIRQYEIEGAKDKLKEIGASTADLKTQKSRLEKQIDNQEKEARRKEAVATTAAGAGGVFGGTALAAGVSTSERYRISELKGDLDDVNQKLKENAEIQKEIIDAYGDDIQKSEINNPPQTPTITNNGDGNGGGGGGNGGTSNSSGKSDKATTDPLAKEKAYRKQQETMARIAYATGEINYREYTEAMLDAAEQYYQTVKDREDLSADERLEAEAAYYENRRKQQEEANKRTLEQENASYAEQVAQQKQRYLDGQTDYKTYTEAIEQLEMQHLQSVIAIKKKQGEDTASEESQYQDRLVANRQRHQQQTEAAEKQQQERLRAIKDEYFGLSAAENKAEYDTQLAALNEVYAAELAAAQDNANEKLRIEDAFQKAKAALAQKYNQGAQQVATSLPARMQQAVQDSVDWLNSDGGKAVTESFNMVVSSMSSIFSQLTTIVQAELQIQTAAIERRYSAEISAAEGNNYKVKQLERQKEEETTRAKREANRKQFSMQVMQALAQAAQGAIAAYSSAAAIPVTGWILAPIAAAAAVAAGMLQVQAIKKQQQASEASGYAQGGFTPKGPADKEVGVVHAGEWVASQRLLANPTARALIDTLDYAQRTNTIPSLSAADVSRSVTAPAVLATTSQDSGLEASIQATAFALSAYTATMQKMQQRLSEPFVTVNTVTGDTGIQRAQDEYSRLMKNKSPRNK